MRRYTVGAVVKASDHCIKAIAIDGVRPTQSEVDKCLTTWATEQGLGPDVLAFVAEAKQLVESELALRELAAESRGLLSGRQLSEMRRSTLPHARRGLSSYEYARSRGSADTLAEAAMFHLIESQEPLLHKARRKPAKRVISKAPAKAKRKRARHAKPATRGKTKRGADDSLII